MYNTHVRPVRELRNNYPEIATLIKQKDRVLITNNGKGEAVILSLEEYQRYEQILHERYIDEKLAEAEREAADPNTVRIFHDDFWKEMKETYDL